MWPNPQDTANLVTFTEEILNGKFHFLCGVKVVRTFEADINLRRMKIVEYKFPYTSESHYIRGKGETKNTKMSHYSPERSEYGFYCFY